MKMLMIVLYMAFVAFFVWDTYRTMNEDTPAEEQVVHYIFAIMWPIAMTAGFVLFCLDFIKNRNE